GATGTAHIARGTGAARDSATPSHWLMAKMAELMAPRYGGDASLTGKFPTFRPRVSICRSLAL
ncbi:MAG TPA: hypothetical protein PK264_22815, partial [Hyphomicrobiaceae bacterium]|nr:hypothetical protein [Hyphomicrobiaceae bacterium]